MYMELWYKLEVVAQMMFSKLNLKFSSNIQFLKLDYSSHYLVTA